MKRSASKILVFLTYLLILSACATTPPPKETSGPVFYPPPPAPPRVQHLASFSSAADLAPPQSGFAAFLLGKDPKEEYAVQKPYGVAIWNGRIYVVDAGGPGYAVFDLKSRQLKGVSGSGGGKLRKPINIAIDKDGTKYVTDTGLNQVLVFDRDEKFLKAFGSQEPFRPVGVAIWGDRLYVSDIKNHEILVLDKLSGKLLFKFGKAGAKEDELFFPTNIVIGSDEHIYVSNTGNFRIQKYTLDGKFVRSFGKLGRSPGQFARPKGVAVDREGHLYVVDAAFENIQVFDKEGRLLLFFAGPGGNREDINLPTAIVIDYENVPIFQQYAAPKFNVEYLILVASQFGASKVNVYGFGVMEGADYTVKEPQAVKNN